MKKLYALIIILIITNLPLSCDFNCDCCDMKPMYSTIRSLSSQVGFYDNDAYQNFTSSSIDGNEAILVYVADVKTVESRLSNPAFSIMNVAVACDPADPHPTQQIDSIIITSASPIYLKNRSYQPGSDLTSLFQITNYNLRADQLKESSIIFGALEDFLIFQLIHQPDSSIHQSFSFEFNFDDDSSLTLTTDDFVINLE